MKAEGIIKIRNLLSPAGMFMAIAVIILVAALFLPVFIELTHIWLTSADYSHGFLVLPISLYMVWQKRSRLMSIEIQPSWAGSVLLVPGLLLYGAAFVTNFNSLVYLSMLIIIVGIIILSAGTRFARELLFPILFLLFMFPIPSSYYIMITNPLKLMITNISALIMGSMGIPVLQDGNLLFFANTQLEVAEACSGVRSLYSYLMLGCLFAVFSIRLRTKLILILSAIPLAILVNIVRVTVTGVLSNYYGPEVAQGFFHEFTGFILFAVGFVLLVLEYYALKE